MASWNTENIVLTRQGDEILSKVQLGIGKISVSRVVTGGGYVNPAQLYSQTEVNNEKQEMTILSHSTTSNGSALEVQITNEGLEQEYDIYQIGIYVTHQDYDGEVLYMIAQCDLDNPDHVPLPAETPLAINYSLYMTHSGTAQVTIEVDPAGAVSLEAFNLLRQEVNSHIQDTEVHVTLEEKEYFYDKYSCSDMDTMLSSKLNKDFSNADASIVEELFSNDEKILEAITEHNANPSAHAGVQSSLASLEARVKMMELKYDTDISGVSFLVDFDTLEGLVVTGVWNEELARIEF